jgi:hypothetical protein
MLLTSVVYSCPICHLSLFPVIDFACVPLASFGFSFLVVIEIGSLPDQYTVLFHIGIVRHLQARQKTVGITSPNRLPGISTLNCSFLLYWNSSTFSSATKNSWIYLPEQIAGNINFELFIFVAINASMSDA